MDQRISAITLGVADVPRARAFYDRLGWKAAKGSDAGTAFYQMNGLALILFGMKELAKDAGVERPGAGFDNISIAYNVASEAQVKQVLAKAKKAGGTILREASKAFWGGFTGYFADPDGHAWEVAYNPHWTLDAKGNVKLPK
ncbi:MAG: VOC family protein [Rhodospirillaceae bacterium]|nr:VOC family protein [Rhodospirillaceae bacterium]